MTDLLKDQLEKTKNRKESYSSLSLLKQCPYKYFLKYIKGNYCSTSSIALEIGNICHKVMELKESEKLPFNKLTEILTKGYHSTEENLKGIREIKDFYFDDWLTVGRKSGISYQDKINSFVENRIRISDSLEWEIVATEKPFLIEVDGVKITGKIDKVEKNSNGDYKITDYKTNDKVFDDKDLKTPLQMYIYALACNSLYGKFPVCFEYDFLLLNEKRQAMSKGWEKRGQTQLKKLLEEREAFYQAIEFAPNPTPLCYWCEMSQNSYIQDETNGLCKYFSLWTPTNKSWEVNEKYIPFSCSEENEEFDDFDW